MGLIINGHAKERMAERRITSTEIEEALTNAQVETPGKTPDRVNRWGYTSAGRRLRITQYRDSAEFIISVIAPDEEDGE